MSKINEALVMMAEQKETFEVNGKKFQVIEVKYAEQQPDYSHLVGKWVKYNDIRFSQYPIFGKWILIKDVFYNETESSDGDIFFPIGWWFIIEPTKDTVGNRYAAFCFDLSNPSDTNPDEKKVWKKANEDMWEMDMIAIFETDYDCPKIKEHFEKEWKHIRAYLFLSKFADLCNEGRVVDWTEDNWKYVVYFDGGNLKKNHYCELKRHIAFLDEEARDYSLKVHEAIWKDYWGIEP